MCNREVFQAFHGLVVRRRRNRTAPGLPSKTEEIRKPIKDPPMKEERETKSPMKRIARVYYDLPRRLFSNLVLPSSIRTWRNTDPPLPFLRYLFSFSNPAETNSDNNCIEHDEANPLLVPNVNANQGYALTKAVHAQFIPLVRFLLEHGAESDTKDGIAVMVAIRQKNLKLVKMLIEREDNAGYSDINSTAPSTPKSSLGQVTGTKKMNTKQKGSAKRRRLEDRMKPDSRMLKAAVQCKAKDIVEYLCHEKGVVPDIQTLQLMM
ncbi:hypothetical protein CC1G_06282 [Coprinopsis cinerea okayama7|uniref:Uncharacterized protein n=1 Tax=Coprinopsis cinerea (strain Okayama-7 / 130 / ATCC MYA-4618 / FGSC 9003) TaxID=240176 RepID=A8NTC8_COPC7|nr:hypothetical protein CC1G_06282 [Coprinopsis cinerea okayama7\|eukprot:XP_001836197.2 hypothetical protein CC1G_06282 [Coprinopsis cinerea okayama7\